MSQDFPNMLAHAAPPALDPLRFSLRGSRLIEASAGTGKTFTIAALYVRLVLQHGNDEAAFSRELTPAEILVVTFTEAASKELRDRIRARLAAAAEYFRADPAAIPSMSPGQDLLHDLRAAHAREAWPGCARKLQLAAESMDEAAVSTIHAWCNRMLREHAFDSGSLFAQSLETDQSALLGEVVRDYWRSFMLPLDRDAVERISRWWKGPRELEKDIKQLIGHVALLGGGLEPEKALAEQARRLEELKSPWKTAARDWVGELQQLLDDARKKKLFDGTRLKSNHYEGWLKQVEAWRDDSALIDPGLSYAAKSRLTTAGLADVWNDKSQAPAHPALDALEQLHPALARLQDEPREAILRHAARWVAGRFGAEQQRRAQMGFDDLLTRLDAALRGANGGRLAARIREAFPVALIDEFQDTDPVQYRIFKAVYGVDANSRESALVLIGDPKQAIYAFRGADIHTYLAARRDCAGRLYTLKRNFRSTTEMVAAVNRCFDIAETREAGRGAFLFRTADDNPVPFVEADANGRKEALRVDGQPWPALTAWYLPAAPDGKELNKDAHLERMAASCATEMVRLLGLGRRGSAGFAEGDEARPLRPADMAVLVNNAREARAIRKALDERGVRSVYLSDRDSVWTSPQAEELQHWLAACAEPDNPRLLRAALATATLGLDWFELDRLRHDERAWEGRVQQFHAYRVLWRRYGVLPMLRRLLHDFRVPARLLGGAGGSGERVLTDLLHLAELLQQAAGTLEGEQALIRLLADARAGTGGEDAGGNEAARLRLESDSDLVQVVTVHKSKGLEYPLVFLPFACSYRETKKDDLPLKTHGENGELQVSLSGGEELAARADGERLGEDLRKLYVALTRARHATWVGLAPIKGVDKSAIGYLLGVGQQPAPDALEKALENLAKGCPSICVEEAPGPSADRLATQADVAGLGEARKPKRMVRERWWIASYSALKIASAEAGPVAAAAFDPHAVPDTAMEDIFREEGGADARPAAQAPEPGSIHALPRGSGPGTFLHDVLEWAARTGFATVTADDGSLLRDTLARRCALRGWKDWIKPLHAWAMRFLTTSFGLPAVVSAPANSFSFAALDTAIAEMEFWLPVSAVNTTDIDALVCEHTLGGATRRPLVAGELGGMLKGFIDLVFEHEGRYYIADYKSNWLGADDAAYTEAAMRDKILEARYELQYVLYLLALHRLLRLRLPGYDYDEHIGGAVYLFLRGVGSNGQGVHFERPPRALIEALDCCLANHSHIKEPA